MNETIDHVADYTKMNPTFVTLVAAVSTRDQVPFDKAIITAGNMLAALAKKEAA